MRKRFNIIALASLLLPLLASQAGAQASRDDFPFSIMTPEPGQRRAPPRVRQETPPPAKARPAQEAKKPAPPRVRGSSTFSTIPTAPRSVVTPLGTAPKLGTAPSMANPASPSAPVPGISGVGGAPAMTPPRPAGQGFQDRASGCMASGTAQGVGPGQIGAFTQSCVNR